LVIGVYFTSFQTAAQSSFQDSLLPRFAADPFDQLLSDTISYRIFRTIYEDPDQAIFAAKQVQQIARENGLRELEAKMLMYGGIAYDFKGMYDSTFLLFDQGLEIADKNNLNMVRGDLLNNYSITLAIVGKMGESIDHALSALAIFESAGDSARLSKVYNNLGLRYSEMDFKETALEYYLKATAINERLHDSMRLAYNYGNIGLLYYELTNSDSAYEYLIKSLKLQDTIQNRMEYSISLHFLALVYEQKQLYDEAFALEHRAYVIAEELHDDLGMIPILRGKASIKSKLGEMQSSLNYLNQALELAQRIGARIYLINIYQDMAEIHAKLNNFKEAFRFNSLYTNLKDSIQSVEKNKAVELIKQFESEKKEREIKLLTKDSEIQQLSIKRQKIIKNSVIIVGGLLLILAILLYHRYRYVRKTNSDLAEKNQIINYEKDRSDKLLLNILPAETAEELKTNGYAEAKTFQMVTVMFTDFVGFTKIAEKLPAQELVGEIDYCFKNFDEIISNFNIEKIKTIGDSYMCAGGLPVINTTNPLDVVKAGIEIQRFMLNLKAERKAAGKPYFDLRLGIHTGPVIAGVVGVKKYQYDIWGDTVNIASRMESSSEPEKVNISQTTFEHIKDHFTCTYRGKIEAKNKGFVDMYYVDFL
jgi:class 3 adenylate cyclase/Tfp pilus assembly protein PilF